mgnify:CR=1 FL=1
MQPVFIVFEGGEKVGKTTQLQKLKTYLENQGHSVVLAREPGGGDPHIREKLLHMKSVLTPEQELALFCKDRKLHIKHVISPALQQGKIVICDRFEPSTIAYQGYGRGMDITLIKKESAKARNGIWPDLIILLDADPTKVINRREASTRFDAEKIDFHRRVRKGFLAQAKADPQNWRIIDATQSLEVVWKNIQSNIHEFLAKRKDTKI